MQAIYRVSIAAVIIFTLGCASASTGHSQTNPAAEFNFDPNGEFAVAMGVPMA